MKAVFKKEFKGYFTSVSGFAAIAAVIFIVGFFFRMMCLQRGYGTMVYALYYAGMYVFLIVTPVLSMRTFTAETRHKTDQLLYTSPVSVTQIVLGKFLAMAAVFTIPVLVICVMPLILKAYGGGSPALDYTSIFAFYLMGLAYLAAGMFISSLTGNVVVSLLGTVLFVLLTQLLYSMTTSSSGSELGSLIFLIIAALFIGGVVWLLTKSWRAGAVVAAVLVAVVLIAYTVNSAWFAGRAEDIAGVLDFQQHYLTFLLGSFSLKETVYFLSVIFVALFVTDQSIRSKRWS